MTSMFNSGSVSVEVEQITFDGEFSHWLATLKYNKEIICECTAPTFWGALDCAIETITEDGSVVDQQWLSLDANKN